MENNKFFPVSINLNGEKVLIIGAGKIALRKAKTLMNYGCDIYVVATEILEDEFHELGLSSVRTGKFCESDLEGVFLVVAATSDKEFNREVANLCMARKILVNNITSKDEMNLRFASIYEGDGFQVAVSSLGYSYSSRGTIKKIRDLIELSFL